MANTQLLAHCFWEKSNLSLNFVTLPGKTWQNYGSTKIRSFSPYGERIPSDPVVTIGKINRKIYFHNSISKKNILRPSFFETEDYDTRAHAVCRRLLATVGLIRKITAATISGNDLINSMDLTFYKAGENGRNMVKIFLDWKHFPESN